MAENVIRKDVIELSIDADLKGLTKLQDEINSLKKKLTGDMGSNAFNNLKNSANNATSPLNKVKNTAEEVVKKVSEIGKNAASTAFNGLKKVVGVSFNSLTNGIKTAVTKVTELGKKAATTAFNGLKKVASISFKALSVGIGAAATAVGGLVTKSVQAYADYEQFVGGVETLFKGNADTVKTYANNAYKTAGLSANEYMDTVTSFSASLISSLGGDTGKAAEYANTAITDMSD